MKDIFRRFLENKDRFIDKLDLTDEQKAELKAFFKKHPTYEGKVDWNKKDLKWEDFEELLKTEGQTKNQIKKYGKSGKAQIEDLVEGKDYEVLVDKPNLTVYYPMNFKASEVLAKPLHLGFPHARRVGLRRMQNAGDRFYVSRWALLS